MSTGTQTEREADAGLSLGDVIAYLPDGSTIPEDVWARRHKGVVVLTLAHIPFLLGLALLEGEESLVTGATFPELAFGRILLQTGVMAGLAVAALAPRLPRRVRTVAGVTALAISSFTLVRVSGGYIEAHFHFFVAVGIAAIYEDWLPFGVGIAYVVATHGLFGMISPELVYNHTAAQVRPWVWGLIHGGFVAMLAGALTVHLSSIQRSREHAQQRLAEAEERATRIDDLEQRQREIEAEREEAQRLKQEAEEQRAEVERLNAHLQEKAAEYRDAMTAVTDGDLTVRVDPDSESDAMAEIGEALNGMIGENERVITELQEFADDVESRTEQAEASVKEAASASASVSDSVQGIAAGADDQREMLDTIAGEMSTLSAAVEEVAASAESVAQASEGTTEVVTEGRALAEGMIEDARAVEDAIDTTVDAVEALDAGMDEIADITDLISDVAEQTNMLALNANIEAARAAGDGSTAGEGFSVVANEVKQLAEETRDSAGDIQDRIADTQEQTARTVTEVERARELIRQEIDAVEQVAEVFAQVADNAAETDDGVQEINTTTDEQAATSEEVVAMVDEVSGISNESAEEAQSASAAAEEQAASMDEVETTVGHVTEQVRELRSLLSAYTVGHTADLDGAGGAPGSGVAVGDGGAPDGD